MTRMKTFKISLKWLTGLSVVILLVTLYFGLRPKDFDFSNNVKGNRHVHKKINNFFILPYVQEVEMKGKQKAKRLGGWEAMKLGSEEGKKITG
jgi:hypothetical protein